MIVAAVILAAGEGRRMGGRSKALLPIGETTFLARVVETAREAGVARIVVVLALQSGAVGPPLVQGDPDVTVVRNPTPERGQLSSLLAGLREAGDTDGILAWPVDHPLVDVATVRLLVEEAVRHPGCVIIPRWQGRGGHPTFFPRALYDGLGELAEGEGARGLYGRHPDLVVRIDVEDAGVCLGIDTPEDYARLPK